MANLPDLETRWCLCGCGKSWRCLPSSLNVYAMRSHNPEKYMPWQVERSRFKKVMNWLDVKCGPAPEPEPPTAILENIAP